MKFVFLFTSLFTATSLDIIYEFQNDEDTLCLINEFDLAREPEVFQFELFKTTKPFGCDDCQQTNQLLFNVKQDRTYVYLCLNCLKYNGIKFGNKTELIIKAESCVEGQDDFFYIKGKKKAVESFSGQEFRLVESEKECLTHKIILPRLFDKLCNTDCDTTQLYMFNRFQEPFIDVPFKIRKWQFCSRDEMVDLAFGLKKKKRTDLNPKKKQTIAITFEFDDKKLFKVEFTSDNAISNTDHLSRIFGSINCEEIVSDDSLYYIKSINFVYSEYSSHFRNYHLIEIGVLLNSNNKEKVAEAVFKFLTELKYKMFFYEYCHKPLFYNIHFGEDVRYKKETDQKYNMSSNEFIKWLSSDKDKQVVDYIELSEPDEYCYFTDIIAFFKEKHRNLGCFCEILKNLHNGSLDNCPQYYEFTLLFDSKNNADVIDIFKASFNINGITLVTTIVSEKCKMNEEDVFVYELSVKCYFDPEEQIKECATKFFNEMKSINSTIFLNIHVTPMCSSVFNSQNKNTAHYDKKIRGGVKRRKNAKTVIARKAMRKIEKTFCCV